MAGAGTAIALSAVFPGLGQLATGHRNRGTALVTAELACLVIWLTSHEDFDTQKTQFEIESQRYLSLREGGSFEAAEASRQRLETTFSGHYRQWSACLSIE